MYCRQHTRWPPSLKSRWKHLKILIKKKKRKLQNILINISACALLLPSAISCPTLTCVWCMDLRSVLWSHFSLEAPGAQRALSRCCWLRAGAVYHPATSPASWLGWIYQLRADAPWHLLICHHRHKPPSIVKCQPPELAGVATDAVQRERLFSHYSQWAENLSRHQHVQRVWEAGVMKSHQLCGLRHIESMCVANERVIDL